MPGPLVFRVVGAAVVALALLAVGLVLAWAWPLGGGGGSREAAPPVSWPYPDAPGPVEVRLAVAGDVGTGGRAEYATAAAMDALEQGQELDALLLLGDNIYPAGQPELAQARVLDPFAAVLDGPTELVAALGNHDVRTGDGEPELKALGLPGRWYQRRFGPVRVVVVDSTRAGDPEQLAWLDSVLAEDDVPWTVVIQHHPPYSAGYHGSDRASQEHLVPRYRRLGVELVLAGHDHDYQRSQVVDGVTYIVSGGAAKLRPTGTADFTAMATSILHFVEIAGDATRLDVRAIDQQGRVFDQFTLGT
ncbi:MAG TPA: metallophosphoesterase [Acidimicrobiales bacterium]|nr:metallophosphoesterase [Acidimicrobiales bacterium]